jgi:hypothetical protein
MGQSACQYFFMEQPGKQRSFKWPVKPGGESPGVSICRVKVVSAFMLHKPK